MKAQSEGDGILLLGDNTALWDGLTSYETEVEQSQG
jgi:hypothetical protein